MSSEDDPNISLIDDSESISNEILNFEDVATSKLYGFYIPNCFTLSTLFFYGISNIEDGVLSQSLLDPKVIESHFFKDCNQHIINQSKFSNDVYITIKSALFRKLLPSEQNPNDYFYLYDRNPYIISHLIQICKHIYYKEGTVYEDISNFDSKDTEQKMLKILRKTKSFMNVCFYSNNIIDSPNIPLHCYSRYFKHANKKFCHSLKMAIGLENKACCLRLFSFKKSYHFCNGNMTEDNLSDNLVGFSPFFLLYTPCILEGKAEEYNHNAYKGNFKSSIPTFPSKSDRLTVFISDLRKRNWEVGEFTFDKYLIECLKFPAAFVVGTNFQDERYQYYLSVFFTNEVTTKENVLKNIDDEEFKTGCRKLFNFYQKFLTFLRYIIDSINFFIEGNIHGFNEVIIQLFSTLPTINPSIASSFIDFIKLLVEKIKATDKEHHELENTLKKVIDCSIDNGSKLTLHLKSIFNIDISYPSAPITVYQAYKSLHRSFKNLKQHLDKNDIESIRKIKLLSNHDESKVYKFYNKYTDFISSTYFTRNDIEI